MIIMLAASPALSWISIVGSSHGNDQCALNTSSVQPMEGCPWNSVLL